MTPEQHARMTLGWTREHLARVSGVNVASVYLLERLDFSGSDDDLRIRNALAQGQTNATNSNVIAIWNAQTG